MSSSSLSALLVVVAICAGVICLLPMAAANEKWTLNEANNFIKRADDVEKALDAGRETLLSGGSNSTRDQYMAFNNLLFHRQREANALHIGLPKKIGVLNSQITKAKKRNPSNFVYANQDDCKALNAYLLFDAAILISEAGSHIRPIGSGGGNYNVLLQPNAMHKKHLVITLYNRFNTAYEDLKRTYGEAVGEERRVRRFSSARGFRACEEDGRRRFARIFL